MNDVWHAVARHLEENDSAEFNPRVFWSVNAFIFALLISVCVWCYCFGGHEYIGNRERMRVASDQTFRTSVMRRREREHQARQETPEQRQKKLWRSFKRCQVHMVCLVDSTPIGSFWPLTLDDRSSRRRI